MSVTNVIKEVDLLLFGEERGTDRVHGRISPSLIVESTFLVEGIKELHVRLRSPKVKVSNLKVGPDCADDQLHVTLK